LQEGRLADVRRADDGDLSGALAAYCDRVAMDDAGPAARRRQLAGDPFPDVGVRAAPVVRQLSEDRAQLADPLRAVLADEPALDHLHLRAMRHWYCEVSFDHAVHTQSRRYADALRRVPPLPPTRVLEAAD